MSNDVVLHLNLSTAKIALKDSSVSPRDFVEQIKSVANVREWAILCAKGEGPYYDAVRQQLLTDFDWTRQPVDEALRELLETFELPKESQQIDRILNAFANRYHEDNPLIFASPDAVHILCFALLMLNTDLHSPHVKKRMSQADFVTNTRFGSEAASSIPIQVLEILYYNVQESEFVMTGTPQPRKIPTLKPTLSRSTMKRFHLPWSKPKMYCQFDMHSAVAICDAIVYLSGLDVHARTPTTSQTRLSTFSDSTDGTKFDLRRSTDVEKTTPTESMSDVTDHRTSMDSVSVEYDATAPIKISGTVMYARKAWILGGLATDAFPATLTITHDTMKLEDEKVKIESLEGARAWTDGDVWWIFLARGRHYCFKSSNISEWIQSVNKGSIERPKELDDLVSTARQISLLRPLTKTGKKRALEVAHEAYDEVVKCLTVK